MSQPPNTPEGSDPTVQYQPGAAQPVWPDPAAHPTSAQPASAQPSAGQPYGAPPPVDQPYPGQPYGSQPYGGQAPGAYGVQPPGQPYSGPSPAPTTTPYPQPPYPGAAQPGYQTVQPGYPYPGGPGYPSAALATVDAWGRPLSDKSKVVAGVLGIALGGFGAGRFYTGHTGIAVAQLLVTIFTCGLGHFWGLIDGIMILANGGTDAQGRILRD